MTITTTQVEIGADILGTIWGYTHELTLKRQLKLIDTNPEEAMKHFEVSDKGREYLHNLGCILMEGISLRLPRQGKVTLTLTMENKGEGS